MIGTLQSKRFFYLDLGSKKFSYLWYLIDGLRIFGIQKVFCISFGLPSIYIIFCFALNRNHDDDDDDARGERQWWPKIIVTHLSNMLVGVGLIPAPMPMGMRCFGFGLGFLRSIRVGFIES